MKISHRDVGRMPRVRTMFEMLERRELFSTNSWQTAFSGLIAKLHVTPAPAVVSQPPTQTTTSTSSTPSAPAVGGGSTVDDKVSAILTNLLNNLHLPLPKILGGTTATGSSGAGGGSITTNGGALGTLNTGPTGSITLSGGTTGIVSSGGTLTITPGNFLLPPVGTLIVGAG